MQGLAYNQSPWLDAVTTVRAAVPHRVHSQRRWEMLSVLPGLATEGGLQERRSSAAVGPVS